MLRIEVYPHGESSGLALTAEQRRWAAASVMPVLKKQVRRRALALGWCRRNGGKLTADDNFVLGSEIDVFSLYDRQSAGSRVPVEIAAQILTATLGVEGVTVGGPKQVSRSWDYGSRPFRTCQGGELRLRGDGWITAKSRGRLVLRRLGDSLDVCVGRLFDGSPCINYRFTLPLDAELESGEPVPVPEDGKSIDMDREVQPDDRLLRLRSVQEYHQAGFEGTNKQKPVVVRAARNLIPASQSTILDTFIDLNEQLHLSIGRVQLPDPSEWLPRTLVEFSSVAELLNHPQFVVTQALERDLLASLSPEGLNRRFLQCTSLRGRISDVIVSPDSATTQLVYADRDNTGLRYQLVPASWDVPESLLEQELPAGKVLCDFVPRQFYRRWEDLEQATGALSQVILSEFLRFQSAGPEQGFASGGILIDARYVLPALQAARTDAQGQPRWYWDFRGTKQYLARGRLVCPPISFPNWDEPSFSGNGVLFILSTQPASANKRPRRRNRRS